MSQWLLASVYGLPHWGWAAICAVFVVEAALGKSSDPRLRSTAAVIATIVRAVLTATRISLVPILGPSLLQALDAVAPSPAPATDKGADPKAP